VKYFRLNMADSLWVLPECPQSGETCSRRLLQSKSVCQQIVLWDIHRREIQLLVCTQLGKQCQVNAYRLFADAIG
jgi:hypothetical protein